MLANLALSVLDEHFAEAWQTNSGSTYQRTKRRRAGPPLLRQLNAVLRGWCTYFGHGVSKATFGYLDQYVWHRVVRWIRKRHNKTKWAVLLRRHLPDWCPTEDGACCSNPSR